MKVLINTFLYKECAPDVIQIRKCLHEVFTLHIRYINRTYIGVARRGRWQWPSKFLRISSHFVL